MLEIVKVKFTELLTAILTNYSTDYDPAYYNHLYDSCFDLADFICVAESKEYLGGFLLNSASAVYVVRSICELFDELNLSDEYDLDSVKHPAMSGGRLREAFILTQEYFERDGLFEVVGSSIFHTTFKKLSD